MSIGRREDVFGTTHYPSSTPVNSSTHSDMFTGARLSLLHEEGHLCLFLLLDCTCWQKRVCITQADCRCTQRHEAHPDNSCDLPQAGSASIRRFGAQSHCTNVVLLRFIDWPWNGTGRIISKMPLVRAVGLSEPRASSTSLNFISIAFCFSPQV